MSATQDTSSFNLGTINNPASVSRPALFFENEAKAVDHLRNHVLAGPENEAWALVFAVLGETDVAQKIENSEICFMLSKAAEEHGAEAVLDLLEAYRKATDQACLEAAKLRWWASHGCVVVALGITAVFVLIVKSVLRTAYIPAQGSPEMVRKRRESDGIHIPTSPPKKMRRSRVKTSDPRHAEREAQWSVEQRIFYKLFRPAVQFIRSRYHSKTSLNGRSWDDIALLKDKLPRMSELGYDKWLEYYRSYR